MGFLQARSGIGRSGVTYCGWTPPSIIATIGGTDCTVDILSSGWSLTLRADGTPPTFKFRTKTITPVLGQDLKLTYATPDEYLFAGTILQRTATPTGPGSTLLQWDCTAVGYQWLIDRYDKVLAQYASVGVGTIVADILARFTDGGFRVGYCPSSLGNLSMTFTQDSNVYASLQRIATAAGNAVLEIGPDRIVNLYPVGTYPEGALATLTQASVYRPPGPAFTYSEDLTQIRTRSICIGDGSTATAVASPGAAAIAVQDTSAFTPAGGMAISGVNRITYTGLASSSGPGSLTGCSGVLYDIGSGDSVNVLVDLTDSGSQTALATLLGGSLSGKATNVQTGGGSLSETTARATADLATFDAVLDTLALSPKTPIRHLRAGQSIPINVTNPMTVSGTFSIQAVTITPRGPIGSLNFEVYQQMQLGNFSRSLVTLLTELSAGVAKSL